MPKPLSDLSKARILVTNDDGVHAPGIAVLERIARSLSSDVWVVAPENEQSAVSHCRTVRRPLRVHDLGGQRFGVDGTPTDSVFLGVRHILQDRPPDLLLSGVNGGCNLAEDVTYSGTVAAAMEGTLSGIPSIALSQEYGWDRPIKWETAEHWSAGIIRRFMAAGWPENILLNVNFPDRIASEITGVEIASQGHRRIADKVVAANDPFGRVCFWAGGRRDRDVGRPGDDLNAVSRGAIAVTPLSVDYTDRETVSRLEPVFR